MCDFAEKLINDMLEDWHKTDDCRNLAKQYPEPYQFEDLDHLYLSMLLPNQEASDVLRISKRIIGKEVVNDFQKNRAKYLHQEFQKFDNRDKLRQSLPFALSKQVESLHRIFLIGDFDNFCEWGGNHTARVYRGVRSQQTFNSFFFFMLETEGWRQGKTSIKLQ